VVGRQRLDRVGCEIRVDVSAGKAEHADAALSVGFAACP
jgi:hypothetical protein